MAVMVGGRNEFRLPPVESLFADRSSQGTVNRIVKRLNKRSFQLGKKAYTNDVLSLSFTDREDNKLEEQSLCTFEDDKNRPGWDIAGSQAYKSSSEDCCAYCLETFGCKAWTYGKLGGPWAGACWLKSSAAPAYSASDLMTGIVQDSQKPVVICPSNVERKTYLDAPKIRVTWALPNATDNSGSVSVTGSHEPGNNFTIGVTTVSYEAEDPSGNTANCWFSVIVKDILDSMDTGIAMLQNASLVTEFGDQNRYLLTQSVLDATDSLAKFILHYNDPGSGPVVYSTPSIRLNLESDEVEKLTNVTVKLGDGNEFKLPPAETLFAVRPSQGTVNRIVKRLNRRSFQLGSKAYTNDVLSLSFTDREGNELEVKDTKEDISIIFTSDPPSPETELTIEGVYLEDDDVTYFGFTFNVKESLCTFEDDKNRPGLDIAGMRASKHSSGDCCTFCQETFGCKAWAYGKPGGPWAGICWLKHSVPQASGLSHMMSGIVQDSERPVLVCPPDIETDLDSDMNTIPVTWILPNASDNSGTVRVSGSPEPGSNFAIGVTKIAYKAEDPMGNTATCEFSVTVKDTRKPVIICPSTVETKTFLDKPSVPVTWSFPNATDNSGNVTMTGSHEPGSNFTIGVTTVSYESEDPSGNIANCWFSVIVKEKTDILT
ncbi:hyalin-like [Ptychodera flava]|uniref:hyalin-like n=1 Tax=Ptychodera flava TaxID=63121 RepID=UPI003969D8FB